MITKRSAEGNDTDSHRGFCYGSLKCGLWDYNAPEHGAAKEAVVSNEMCPNQNYNAITGTLSGAVFTAIPQNHNLDNLENEVRS